MDGPLAAADVVAATESLRTEGWCRLDGVIGHAHLDALHARMTADLPLLAAAHQRAHGRQAFNWVYGHLQQEPPRTSEFVFDDVLCNRAVWQVAREVLGDDAWVRGLTGNTNLPGSRWQPVQ